MKLPHTTNSKTAPLTHSSSSIFGWQPLIGSSLGVESEGDECVGLRIMDGERVAGVRLRERERERRVEAWMVEDVN